MIEPDTDVNIQQLLAVLDTHRDLAPSDAYFHFDEIGQRLEVLVSAIERYGRR